VDRAIKVSPWAGRRPRPTWADLRDRIAEKVLEHGWHEKVGAYTVAYGDIDMDAASLWIGLSGLLADDDPRFLSTVLKIEADLRSGPTVYRLQIWDDGLPGREGGFHICAAWLIEAYLRTGRRADAVGAVRPDAGLRRPNRPASPSSTTRRPSGAWAITPRPTRIWA